MLVVVPAVADRKHPVVYMVLVHQVVNALSQDLEVYVHRNETIYHQAYKKGVPQFDLKEVGTTDKTGTVIRFKADGEIFTETTVYNYETLQQRIRELAFLNKGIQITLRDERDEENVREDSYHYEGGIKSYVELLNEIKNLFMMSQFIFINLKMILK